MRNVASKLKLMSTDKACLSSWLVDNYIGQCAQLCPIRISQMFSDVSTNMDLQNIVFEISRQRLYYFLNDIWFAVGMAQLLIAVEVSRLSVTVRSFFRWMNELAKLHECFCIYFSAVALLNVARKVSGNSFNNDLLGILSILLGKGVFSLRKTELNTPELIELLQQSAVERLTTYRQFVARYFASVSTIVITDFEALYSYKRGDYQRCLHLSTQNIQAMLYAVHIPDVSILPEFVQLLDDDIVSLTALTLIVSPECRDHSCGCCITQITLSLYLMTQCQLKLHHSVTSLAQTLHYIKVAQRKNPRDRILDQLTLKLIEHKVLPTISH